MLVLKVRNVNQALAEGLSLFNDNKQLNYRRIAPRAGRWTREYCEPVATVYSHPRERVLLSPERDANPFFHFFEALWICLLYTSPSPRDGATSRMPSSA